MGTPFDSLPSPNPMAGAPARWLAGLEIIRALTAHPRLSEAASALNLTEVTLLHRLEELEAQLRVQLYRRDDGALEPLAAGVALAPFAASILELRDRFFAELSQIAPLQKEITIGASTTAGNYLLPVLLGTFRNRYPDVRVTMEVDDSATIVAAVRAGAYQFGIVGTSQDDPELHHEPFIDDEIVVIAPPDHPLMSKPQLDVAELGDYPWVVREGGSATRASLESMLGQQLLGRRVCVALVLESTEAIKLAVRVGDGIAFVSRRAVQNEVMLGQLKAKSLPASGLVREFYLVRRKSQILAFAAVELWRHLLAAAKEHELRSLSARPADG